MKTLCEKCRNVKQMRVENGTETSPVGAGYIWVGLVRVGLGGDWEFLCSGPTVVYAVRRVLLVLP